MSNSYGSPILLRYSAGALSQNYRNLKSFGSWVSSINVVDRGIYKITGTTKNTSTPAPVPVSRLVLLHESRSGRLIASQWSKPVTGEYMFPNLRNAAYYVCSFDHTGQYNAVIVDKPPLEPM